MDLNFVADSLGKKSQRHLKAADCLSSAVSNCSIRYNFKFGEGNNTFNSDVLPTLNSVRGGQSRPL